MGVQHILCSSQLQKVLMAKDEMRDFGERVRRAREAAGKSQIEIGRAIGRSQSWVKKLETGEISPFALISARLYERLAQSLGKDSFADLIAGTELADLLLTLAPKAMAPVIRDASEALLIGHYRSLSKPDQERAIEYAATLSQRDRR